MDVLLYRTRKIADFLDILYLPEKGFRLLS